jgi:hypothetical protein
VEYLILGGPVPPPPISQAYNNKESIFGFLDNIYRFTYITTIEIGWKSLGENNFRAFVSMVVIYAKRGAIAKQML